LFSNWKNTARNNTVNQEKVQELCSATIWTLQTFIKNQERDVVSQLRGICLSLGRGK